MLSLSHNSPMKDPAAYHAWYETPRGAWIGAREAGLMLELQTY